MQEISKDLDNLNKPITDSINAEVDKIEINNIQEILQLGLTRIKNHDKNIRGK
jgi:hypothetical protein